MEDKKFVVWVCTMDGRGRCGEKGGKVLLRTFEAEVNRRGLKGVIVTPMGCTDRHAHGPAVLVDPDGLWYCGVGKDDVPKIVDSHLCRGEPVEGLVCPQCQVSKPT